MALQFYGVGQILCRRIVGPLHAPTMALQFYGVGQILRIVGALEL